MRASFLTTSKTSRVIEEVRWLTLYRYNGMWSKDVQNVIFAILLCGWLGGMNVTGKTPEVGKLLTIEEVGQILGGRYFDLTTC